MQHPTTQVDTILRHPVAQFYSNKTRVRDDILAVTTNVKSLTPTWLNCNVNGMQEMLIVLSGTIPTYFRGATYQTPVHVIVPYNYPMGVPSIYVKPTPTMIVQPRHRYVNQHDGRVVNLPYLNRWNVRGCLVDAILAVQSVFNSAPPLYAKPASTVSWAQNQGRGGSNSSFHSFPSHQRPPARPHHQRNDSSLSQIKTMLVKQLSSSLSRDITQRFSKLQVEINKEFKAHADLSRREDAIQSGIVTLTKQKQELRDEKQKCERELKEIEDKLETLRNMDDPSKMIQPADVWSEQVFDLVASINAYDDLIFSVEDALENGVIELDKALRLVRQVARVQFMDKALAQKVFQAQKKRRSRVG